MPDLPTGTATFLFTNIEGSTRRWEEQRKAMAAALARHDEIVRSCVEAHGGVVFRIVEATDALLRRLAEASP